MKMISMLGSQNPGHEIDVSTKIKQTTATTTTTTKKPNRPNYFTCDQCLMKVEGFLVSNI